jgi:hypothetical protein
MADLTWRVSPDENGDSSFVHEDLERGLFIRAIPGGGPKAEFMVYVSFDGNPAWAGSAHSLESAADRALESIKSAETSNRRSGGGEVF